MLTGVPFFLFPSCGMSVHYSMAALVGEHIDGRSHFPSFFIGG